MLLASLAPVLVASLASSAAVSFAAQAIAMALAGKVVVEAEFPAKVPRVAPDGRRPMMR